MKIENYGFLRVVDRKIRLADLSDKTLLHEWYNLRLTEDSMPTAGPFPSPPKIILGEPAILKKTIMKSEKINQQRFGVMPCGKRSILVGEFIFNAAAHFQGGKGDENSDQKKMDAWKNAAREMTSKVFGKRAL